ncbi:MAG: terminase small subunit [Acetatifactor sp.]|nr:terminase small subunit [Acetatifactor sp.]
MPKGKDARVDEAFKLYRKGLKLKEISKQLGVPEGTVRSWKSRYQWEGVPDVDAKGAGKNATLRKKKCNVAKNNTREKKAAAYEVREVMKNTRLTDKQQLFCIYYIRCFNATKAYQKAYGVDYMTARAHGYEMLSNVVVKEQIEKLKQERLNREFFSEEDVFQKYMDIAYADITDYADFGMSGDGFSYVRLKEAADVDGTLVTEISQGANGVKIRLADRMKALQWLADHIKSEDDGYTDDGFLDALNATAREDWADETD